MPRWSIGCGGPLIPPREGSNPSPDRHNHVWKAFRSRLEGFKWSHPIPTVRPHGHDGLPGRSARSGEFVSGRGASAGKRGGSRQRRAQRALALEFGFRLVVGLRDVVRAPLTLDTRQSLGDAPSAAAQLAAGVRSPTIEAHTRPSADAGAFLLPASRGLARSPNNGGRCAGAARLAGSSYRSSNRVPSATPIRSGLAVTHSREDRP